MKRKVLFCALLVLLSSADFTWAKGKRKKTKKVNRTEMVEADCYEEIDNFDFLYAGNDSTATSFALSNDIMNQATSLIGARYRSGSKGPNAFDCSGFTSYVFGKSDISIGNSSRDQYARNIPIKRWEMQRGDLVFFSSPGSGRSQVGHVGIVVDYDPISNSFTFIHASSKEGVTISSSTEAYYNRRFIGARRVAK